MEYDENDKPVRLDAVVLSTQHDESVTQEQIHADVKKYIFDEILPQNMIDGNTKFFINYRTFCYRRTSGRQRSDRT